MKLKCKCGNKNANDFRTTAYIKGRHCSDDEPGTVYIYVECENCGMSFSINDFTLFDYKIMISDEYNEEYLDFSRSY